MARRDLTSRWQAIRRELEQVAKPDSRFGLDLDRFIPSFEGNEAATERLLAEPAFAAARTLFVTPDNSVQHLRWQALAAGKTIVVPSYGLYRGFLRLGPAQVDAGLALYASWGDGLEHFGQPVAISDLAQLGRIDAIVAGAAAVSRNGLRFGMGHRYLDLEWNMLLAAGSVPPDTPVWSIVHDCQLAPEEKAGDDDNVFADVVFTPTRTIGTGGHEQPSRLRAEVFTELFGAAPVGEDLRQAVRLVPEPRR